MLGYYVALPVHHAGTVAGNGVVVPDAAQLVFFPDAGVRTAGAEHELAPRRLAAFLPPLPPPGGALLRQRASAYCRNRLPESYIAWSSLLCASFSPSITHFKVQRERGKKNGLPPDTQARFPTNPPPSRNPQAFLNPKIPPYFPFKSFLRIRQTPPRPPAWPRPQKAPAAHVRPVMKRFCFHEGLARHSTARPTPAPVHSPATRLEKRSAPSTYNWVSSTLAAQLGISPPEPPPPAGRSPCRPAPRRTRPRPRPPRSCRTPD